MRSSTLQATLILTGLAVFLAGCAQTTTDETTGPISITSTDDALAALSGLLVEFLQFLPKLLAATVLFIFTLYLAAWISKLLRRIMEGRHLDPGLILLLYHVSRWTIVVAGTITALEVVNFQVTAFLAGLGIIGITIGFALQDISQNIVAGFLLLIQKPFELGDLIKIEEYTGTVQSVDLRSTELLTLDGHNVLMPNASAFTKPITNYSRQARWRINLPVGVAYDSDLELVQRVTLNAVRVLPDILDDPAPILYFHTFNDSSIDFTLHYWIDGRVTNPFTATHPVILAIQKAYQENEIVIPFPIQTEIQVDGAA